jgi:hypothetical protein
MSLKWSFPLRFSNQYFVCISLLPHARCRSTETQDFDRPQSRCSPLQNETASKVRFLAPR